MSKEPTTLTSVGKLIAESAGRGGDQQAELTGAKIRDLNTRNALMEQQLKKAQGEVFEREEYRPGLEMIVYAAWSQFLSLGDKLKVEIDQLYEIDFDEELINDAINETLEELSRAFDRDATVVEGAAKEV